MSIEKKFKKDKEVVLELEGYIKDIRNQLSDQLKCLDVRLDAHLGMLWELQDFYRKRAEVELEYSRSLDRLIKNVMLRHKQEKQKREMWPCYSTHACWQHLLTSTKQQSKDHATLGDMYNNQMYNKFTDIMDDMQRVYKKCREIGAENHEELLTVLNELQSAMKTYQLYHGEAKQAENKLRFVESQKQKVVDGSKQGSLSKKAKQYEKQADKKQQKYTENKRKALVARNEYILSLDTANAAIQRYYCDDLHNLINCVDSGYHLSVQRALMGHVSAEENIVKSRQNSIDKLLGSITELDQRADKQRFLEVNNSAFSLPKKFEFQSHKGDEISQISAQKSVQDELVERLRSLNKRINELKLQNDEDWKSIETVEKSFIDIINQKDYDVSALFSEELKPPKSPHEHYKKRSDRMETEDYYIKKFRRFSLESNLIARLQSKYSSIQKALGDSSHGYGAPRPPSLPPKPKATRRLGKIPKGGQPKLFGGSIEEYVEATEQDIPLVVKSCVRVINLYGRHHQGVFRVSGSQHEINEIKNAFEKGEDPLLDLTGPKDINSVAGVLKLYFRELKEPLFPTQLFDELVNCSRLESHVDFITRVKELVLALPRTIFVVMRYLFMFLSHLSEYSDENMMDSYNLAICFGPTLLPIPPDRDQVQFQNHVIESVKKSITYQEQIFPRDIEGDMYERIVLEEDEDAQESIDNLSDEEMDEIADNMSEDEPDQLEAVAQFDFKGRTEREISFKKGDIMDVYERVSPDWWKGSFRGRTGLIPDKYVSVRTLRDRQEELRSQSVSELSKEEKRRSAESLPARPFDLDHSSSHPNVSNVLKTVGSSIVSHSTLGLSHTPSSSSSGPHSPSALVEVSSFVVASPHQSRSSPHGSIHSLNSTHSKDSLEKVGEQQSLSKDKDSPQQQAPGSNNNLVMIASQTDYTSPSISMAVKGATTTYSLTDVLSESMYSDSGTELSSSSKDRSYSSSSRDTLLSKDSGFSNTSINSSRDTTPVKDNDDLKDVDEEALDTNIPVGDDNDESDEPVKQQPQPEDWAHELDSTLEEIMKGVHSLEEQQNCDKQQHQEQKVKANKPENLPPVITTKDAPDLVLGLPVGQSSPSPTPSPKGPKDDSPTLSTAEMFANNNQSTIKKGSHVAVQKAPMIEVSSGYTQSASTTMPRMTEPPNLADFEMAIKRSQSTTAALRARQELLRQGMIENQKTTLSSRKDEVNSPELPISVLQQRIANVVRPPGPDHHYHQAPTLSPHSRSLTPERPGSPARLVIYTQSTPPPGIGAGSGGRVGGVGVDHIRPSPERQGGLKPSVRAKPPVMKKPGKSPDVLKRLRHTNDGAESPGSGSS